ncbi:MAG: PKD domain-containing protein [Bacteroidota bacterium]
MDIFIKRFYSEYRKLLVCLVLFFLACMGNKTYAQCGPSTPSFTANLIGAPNGTVITPNVARDDTCCGSSAPDKCIKITILLDVGAMGIHFQVYGAVPPGALFYQIGCGPPIAVGTPICLNGQGPHILTFCKPGNNINSYGIVSIPAPTVPDSILVRNGCSSTLATTGFSVPTITWNSIAPGAPGAYNSYLNCTSGCASVNVVPTGVPPPFVDYLVGGYAIAPCESNYYQDTVRVYFYQNLLAGINPVNPTICFGAPNAILTATTSGGLPPYSYTWTTGSNSNTVQVGPGTYTVLAGDNTGCPPTTATAIVSQFTAAITANAGPAQNLCKTSPNVTLNGTIGIASGGIWSGGNGVFSPTSTSLGTTYIPTLTEITNGSVQLYLNSTGNAGCPPGSSTVNITFQNPPVVNAGPDHTVCANNSLVNLSGTVTGFPATVVWSSAGSGTFASTTNSNTTYLPSPADISAGSVNITLTSANNGACPAATDVTNILITPKPIVNAGPDQFICSTNSATLAGSVTGPTNTGTWTTSGDGSFNPNGSALNAAYTPGTNDVNTGTVSIILTSSNNGNCLPVKDTMKITIQKIAVVNSGLNQALCSIAGSVALSGTVTGGTNTGSWTVNGSGAFVPASNSLITSYVMTPADITNGSVIFTLTSTNNGPCPAVTDSVKITIQQLATVNAGANQLLCSSQNSIALSGLLTGSSGTGSWSASGTGPFTPNITSLVNSYSLTTADINAGFVTFTLTSTNNGVCPAVSDTVKMTVTKLPLVNAGLNQYLCSSSTSISLSGTVTGGSTSGSWASSGTGTFNPGTAALNTTYAVTPADVLNGSVMFTLTSTNNGPCPVVADTVNIAILTIASVNSGSNQSVCSSQNSILLNGSVLGASGTGSWSATGTGPFSPGNSSLNTSYSMTPSDVNTGSVTFTLTSTNNGICPVRSDTVKIRITKLALVNAGLNQAICSVQTSVALTGTVNGGANSGVWSSSSNGAFNPSANVLTTAYVLSPLDITNGTVLLTLTSTNDAPCPSVNDTVRISIKTPAQVNAGPSQTICSNTSNINLSGTVIGASATGSWSASGSGTFSPSHTSLATNYSMTANDITNGFVTFTLSSTGNGGCPVVTSAVSIGIRQIATVNAGADKIICSTQTNFIINGVITGATTTGSWSTSGAGGFLPNANSLISSYNTSTIDIAQGTVLLILTSSNNGVCPAVMDTLKLSIIKNPKINLRSDTTICEKQNPVILNGEVIDGSGAVQWTSNGTGTFSPGFTLPTSYLFTPSDINMGTVIVSLNSVNNGPCGNSKADMRVKILPSAKAIFNVSSSLFYIPAEPLVLTNQSTNASSYIWNFGDGEISTLTNPTHNYTSVGYYNITLIANNNFNCSDTSSVQITAISDIQFPNAFTPNPGGANGGSYSLNDFSNDVFFPYTAGVTEYELLIFNRWGELIFRSNNIDVGWDGYLNGKLCQQDAYVWKADLKFFDGRTYNKTGSVTLLR